MPRYLLCLIVLLLAPRVASAQSYPPPASYPPTNRLVCFGYDKTLAIVGDLASITPGAGSPQNNGIVFGLPARNVQFVAATNRWVGEIGQWTGAAYVWSPVDESGHACAYYPGVAGGTPDPHLWYTGVPVATTGHPYALLGCRGYDGTLAISGDLSGGQADDGILFSLPVRGAHHLEGVGLIHAELWLAGAWYWIVYPGPLCGLTPISQALFTQITGGNQ